jgi:MurNAc alpha-1-phosphate uridylyltransferase
VSAQAVILAGGLATRMLPRTLTTPKVMLPVRGRPFIDWQLEKIASAGYTDVVLCIAHLGEQVRDYVGDGARHGMTVRYSEEGPNLLGTAGALRAALPLLAETFLVTYGDSYLPFDYRGPLTVLERHDDCEGVMSVYKNSGAWDASNVIADDEWVQSYQKGTTDPAFDHIDYGAIALRRNVIEPLPAGEKRDLAALQMELAQQGRLRAYRAEVRFYEIGSEAGLSDLEHFLAGAP